MRNVRAVVKLAGKGDEVRGRIQEAAGIVDDDEKLLREGKIDQAAGKVELLAGRVAHDAANCFVYAGKRSNWISAAIGLQYRVSAVGDSR